jgi:hypothetical protein
MAEELDVPPPSSLRSMRKLVMRSREQAAEPVSEAGLEPDGNGVGVGPSAAVASAAHGDLMDASESRQARVIFLSAAAKSSWIF